MKRFVIVLFIIIILSSCATSKNTQTLSDFKKGKVCIEYKEAMAWDEIRNKIGEPDIATWPEAGTKLTENYRGYNNITIIFHTTQKEIKDPEGRIRFMDIIDKIEICK